MSKASVNVRALLYVAIAMLTYAMGDVEKLREADWVGISKFIGGAALAGLITFRAFIDKSATEVVDGAKSVVVEAVNKVAPVALLLAALLLGGCVAFEGTVKHKPSNISVTVGYEK